MPRSAWLSDDQRLGPAAAAQLSDDSNQVLLSAVVVWEAAIKRSLGKLDTPGDLAATLLAAGALPLPHRAQSRRRGRHAARFTTAIRSTGC